MWWRRSITVLCYPQDYGMVWSVFLFKGYLANLDKYIIARGLRHVFFSLGHRGGWGSCLSTGFEV